MKALLQHLLVQTIYAPAQAARLIAGLKLPPEAGWMALALAGVFNTLVYFANMAMVDLPVDFWIPVIRSPLVYLILSLSFTTVMVFCLYWVGRVQGGRAELSLLVTLVAWLLAVQSLADLLFLVLLVFVPMLASLFSMAAGLYGLWIFLNFVQIAHGFPGKGQAVVTILLALIGLMTGLTLFISAIGVTSMGIS
ncbi:YIP1 family protein [Shimia sp.]|uniref:YIP1 family protein n=1 Tax=Shimia sp. TaxID=1954381 RepID=UPI00356979D6